MVVNCAECGKKLQRSYAVKVKEWCDLKLWFCNWRHLTTWAKRREPNA